MKPPLNLSVIILHNKFNFQGEVHANPMEFNVTVEYPPELQLQDTYGTENLFDGDVLEFDHSIFKAINDNALHPTTEATPQM